MGASGTDNFCLRWNDFADNVSGAFKELRAESDFFDVTLACSDSGSKTLQAHKVILSACSNFFKATFRQQSNANKHPNPYIYLRGVTYSDLVSILDFIYNGEVNVAQEELNSFLAVAEELQIKGLTNRDKESSSSNDTASSSNAATSGSGLTPSKKPGNSARKTAPSPSTGGDQPAVKKARRSSPAPAPVTPQAVPEVHQIEDVKEMVNIKHDPEAALASTSAVNPADESGAGPEYAGEDYDESYDGYYEEDGAELGEGQGTDGTKGSTVQVDPRWIQLESGEYECLMCKKRYTHADSVRRHFKEVHVLGKITVKCPICLSEYTGTCAIRTWQQHIKKMHPEHTIFMKDWLRSITSSLPK